MIKARAVPLLALMLTVTSFAQTTTARRVVQASGDATVSVKPDQAKVTVGVITQATTAQEAASKNATQVDAVIGQLRATLGAGADIKTVGYSLVPNYQYPQNATPILTGYTATNNVEITTGDLSAIGKVIDAATQSGANNVGGLNFSLKDPEPVRSQALQAAAKMAKSHAEAIAAGLGLRLGAVLTAQEGSYVRPLTADTRSLSAAGGTTTPIETGLVQVYATVSVEIEIAQ